MGELELAWEHCGRHREEVLRSAHCGCFSCGRVFAPGEISEWVDERDGVGMTALCPHCGIDSVIGSAAGYPLTSEFLDRMHRRWFT